MFGEDPADHAWRRTVLIFILLTVNAVSGIIGGLGIAYAAALDTLDHQILGMIFCFIFVVILLVSAFIIFLHRERERLLQETLYPV